MFKISNKHNKAHLRKIYVLSFLLSFFIVGSFFLGLNFYNNNSNYYDKSSANRENNILQDTDNLKNQDISSSNVYSGIGAPWNVTHFANRTDYNLPVSFSEGSYDDSQGVPLYGWEGYQLNATINNLYDERNWNNGTFNFGADDGYQDPNHDDSTSIPRISNNRFQNWTFGYTQVGSYVNSFSGNYIHNYGGQYDSLELRMDGSDEGSGWYGYNDGDQCGWNTSINIPRGNLIDSKLILDLNPVHCNDRIRWYIRVYINDIMIFTRTTRDLIDLLGYDLDDWVHFEVPLAAWVNTSNVFSGKLEDSRTDIKIALEFNGPSAVQSLGGTPVIPDYQQVLVKDLQLITKAEVNASQIGLKVNKTNDVNDIDWGKGEIDLNANGNNWQGVKTFLNFSATDVGLLGDYNIYLDTDINLYTQKSTPETVYEANENSFGTRFTISNNSLGNWDTYAFVELPEGYEETLMILDYPTDINITKVFDPQKPTLNILNKCNNNTEGKLLIPINNISITPDGFWNFKAISPNYCETVNIYNDVTGSWVLNSTFYSGDNINITASIDKTSLVEDYIDSTQATLDIRFPNGTIWTAKHQMISVDGEGLAKFTPFQIPQSSGYDYKTGLYQVIITWNNSYSTNLANEIGVIYTTFTVIHDSVLETVDGIYYIENILNDRVVNIEVSFKDKIDNSKISNAEVYAKNLTGTKFDLVKISAGVFLLQYDVSKLSTGNNTLTIFANSTYYSNQKINITLDVIEKTRLSVSSDFITDISYYQNLTLTFNYTQDDTPENEIDIDTEKDFSTTWNGDYSIKQNIDGSYNLTCNTTNYAPAILQKFTITVKSYKFQSQTKTISFLLSEISSKLVIRVNNTEFKANDIYTVEVWQKINITAYYTDEGDNIIPDANITVSGEIYKGNLSYDLSFNHYDILMNASDLGQGIDYLEVYAESTNYKPNSIPFVIQITENKTQYQVLLNGKVRNSIEIPLGSDLNITAKYLDSLGNHITGASANLTGDYNDSLTEYKVLQQYSIIIDTDQLSLGIRIITLEIKKNNFETQTEELRIVLRKIKTSIVIEDEEDTIEIKAGQDFTLKIELLDLDNGGRISGILVSYDWKLKDGDFDETSGGLYEAKLKEIPEGSYTITISFNDPTGKYDFNSIEINLNSEGEKEESMLFMVLFIIAAVIVGTLASYIIYYQKVLKYPKPVRKVRKYRRTLKKSKSPSVDINNREKAFNEKYSEKRDAISGLSKKKFTSEPLKAKDASKKPTLNKRSPEKTNFNKEVGNQVSNDKISKDTKNNSIDLYSQKKDKKKSNSKLGGTLNTKNSLKNKFRFSLKNGSVRRINSNKIRRVFLLSLLLIFLTGSLFIVNFMKPDRYSSNNKNDLIYNNENNPKPQELDLTSDNPLYNGIGGSWNVTHFANRTDSNLPVTFTNHTYDTSQSAILGTGWGGYKLNATVNNLYDTRNWINGTFHFGSDDGTNNANEDDDNLTPNWTFAKNDGPDNINPMSGNYIDSNDALGNYEDCLELRIDDEDTGYYDNNDYCWWTTSLNIPRGAVADSTLKIDIYPSHLYDFNDIKLLVYINNQEIWSIGVYELKERGYQQWNSFSIPQSIWTNTSNVYPSILDGNPIPIRVELRDYVNTRYSGFINQDYQQVFFDNLELILKAQVNPEEIGLKMNNSEVDDLGWGRGTVEVEGNWKDIKRVYANFSSNNQVPLGGYGVNLVADLNLYAQKETLDTVYEQDTSSSGIKFSVNNNSNVNWEAYGYVAVPTGYKQTIMRVKVPTDVTINWVSSPQKPSENVRYTHCSYSDGILSIPVSTISGSSKPNGFWKILGTSNNYISGMTTYNDRTGGWVINSTFNSGDKVNIRATITKTSLIESYIANTYAKLDIRFPNGSLWTAQSQLVHPNTDGLANFSSFQIPTTSGYNYQAGEYEAIVTWNNSYNSFLSNESGIYIKKFVVIHDSVLAPDDGAYYIGNIVDDKTVNIKLIYKDKENNEAIENAQVYYKNATNHIVYLSNLGYGKYNLEYDTTKALAGNNTITIYANSTYYQNQRMNITLDVTKQTTLTVDDDYISVASKDNFTIFFNYTELNSPSTGINTNDLSTDWNDEYTFAGIANGRYTLTCNNSQYTEVNKLYTLIINVESYRYEPQAIPVRVYISELGSRIRLFVNNTPFEENEEYTIEVWQQINVTVKYETTTGQHLPSANVTIIGGLGKLTENNQQYTKIINASDLEGKIQVITIFANKSQYNSQTTQFIAIVTERQTEINVKLNNNPGPPVITLPFNSILNIKVYYNDSQDQHVPDASVSLIGAGSDILLKENAIDGYYSTTLSVNNLNLGVNFLSVYANKTNYQSQSDDIRVTIRKIKTEVTTEDGDKTFEIRPGENFNLEVLLKNLDFNIKITDAEVSYSWEGDDGDLDETDDGVYETTLENVPEGTYTITISVFVEGGLYEFEDLKITLVVKTPEGESLLFIILFVVAVTAALGLGGYFVAYYYVLRYPKPVRKVRKFRSTLKKAKTPSKVIFAREKAFDDIYSGFINKVDLKLGKAPKITIPDKVIKETIEEPSKGQIKK